MGQTDTHLPQRMQEGWGDSRSSALVSATMALVPLITGVERSAWERPIMGPPAMTFHTSPCRPPAASMAWAKGGPDGDDQVLGLLDPVAGDQ